MVTQTLIVKKVVINNNGGTKTASDFSFKINDGDAIAFEADGQNNVTESVGTYTVTELAVGEEKTCTITNDDNAPTSTSNSSGGGSGGGGGGGG